MIPPVMMFFAKSELPQALTDDIPSPATRFDLDQDPNPPIFS
jgi:hypothetical protein